MGFHVCNCSMGGAIAVRVAAKRVLPTLAGLVVVDVVEVGLVFRNFPCFFMSPL